MGGQRMLGQWKHNLLSGSFRGKLITTAIACILLPICITLIVSGMMTKETVKRQAVSNAEETLQIMDGYVSNLLRYMLLITNYIQIDSEINTILKEQAEGKTYEGENAEYQQFTDRYRVISKIDNISFVGDKSYVTILQPNGNYYTNYETADLNPIELFEEPWFEQLQHISGYDSFWVGTEPTRFRISRSANPFQLTVARTLRTSNTTIYGYVIVTIMENQINEIFDRLARGQEIMLVDGGNRILSHIDEARIGDKLTYLPIDNGDASTHGIIDLDGTDYLLVQHPLWISGWKLVMLKPYEEAIQPIMGIFNSMFILQLIAFITFLILLVYLLQTFTRPLTRLANLASTVQRGNLEVRSRIRGQDEIGRLGMSFDQMLDHIKAMIREITLEQTRKRQAELAMLQAQINPHFLFNVLNSIRMNVLRKGDKDSAEMISSLSKLLRMTVDRDRELILLHEEIEIVIDYVRLMNMRQKEKVKLEVDLPAEALLERVPRFVLQPIIENAMIHGLHQIGGTIRIGSEITADALTIIIEDDGLGMDQDTVNRLQRGFDMETAASALDTSESERGFSGIGLSNVHERMRITFGDRFSMEALSQPGQGTRIQMIVPRRGVNSDVLSDAGR
jgi:two-component system, sensor histidine kinase YesM